MELNQLAKKSRAYAEFVNAFVQQVESSTDASSMKQLAETEERDELREEIAQLKRELADAKKGESTWKEAYTALLEQSSLHTEAPLFKKRKLETTQAKKKLAAPQIAGQAAGGTPKPRGRPPAGMEWDGVAGKWKGSNGETYMLPAVKNRVAGRRVEKHTPINHPGTCLSRGQ